MTKDQQIAALLRRISRRTRIPLGPPSGGFPPRHGMEHEGRPPMHGPGHPPMMPREIVLMAVLDAGDAGVRQKDLAQELGINPSTLSEAVDRLETDRYLERKANPNDRRSTLIALTEKGKARAWEVQDERAQAASRLCAPLSEEEKDTLIALLQKLDAQPLRLPPDARIRC